MNEARITTDPCWRCGPAVAGGDLAGQRMAA